MTSLCRVKMNRALKRSGRDTLDVEAQTRQVLTGAVHKICVCSYQIKQRVTRDEALQAIRRDFVHVLILHPPTLRAARRGCLWVCPLSKSGPQSESSWCRCACKPPAALRGLRAQGAWRWGGASGRQYGCKDRCSSRKLHRGSDAVASDLLSSRSFSVRVARLAGLLCGSCTRACSTANCP